MFWRYDKISGLFSRKNTHIHKYCVVSGLTGPLEASRYCRLKTSADFLSLTLFKTSPLASGSPSASPVVPPLHLMHLYPAHVNSLRFPSTAPCLCFLQQAWPSIHFSVSNATHALNLTSKCHLLLGHCFFFLNSSGNYLFLHFPPLAVCLYVWGTSHFPPYVHVWVLPLLWPVS